MIARSRAEARRLRDRGRREAWQRVELMRRPGRRRRDQPGDGRHADQDRQRGTPGGEAIGGGATRLRRGWRRRGCGRRLQPRAGAARRPGLGARHRAVGRPPDRAGAGGGSSSHVPGARPRDSGGGRARPGRGRESAPRRPSPVPQQVEQRPGPRSRSSTAACDPLDVAAHSTVGDARRATRPVGRAAEHLGPRRCPGGGPGTAQAGAGGCGARERVTPARQGAAAAQPEADSEGTAPSRAPKPRPMVHDQEARSRATQVAAEMPARSGASASPERRRPGRPDRDRQREPAPASRGAASAAAPAARAAPAAASPSQHQQPLPAASSSPRRRRRYDSREAVREETPMLRAALLLAWPASRCRHAARRWPRRPPWPASAGAHHHRLAAGRHDGFRHPALCAPPAARCSGQSFVVENRPGGGGSIAWRAVAQARGGRLHAAADRELAGHRAAADAGSRPRRPQRLHADLAAGGLPLGRRGAGGAAGADAARAGRDGEARSRAR